jgi:hypothetical protein
LRRQPFSVYSRYQTERSRSQKHGEEAHLIVFRKDELEGVERFFSFGWLEVRVVFDLGLVKGDEATVDALEEVQSISEEKRIGDSGSSWMEEGRERRDLSCCFDMSRRDETSNLDAVYRSEPSKSSRCQPCSSLCLSQQLSDPVSPRRPLAPSLSRSNVRPFSSNQSTSSLLRRSQHSLSTQAYLPCSLVLSAEGPVSAWALHPTRRECW